MFASPAETAFDGLESEDADEHSEGIIKDVGDEVPEAFVGAAVFVGEGDRNGKIDKVREELRDELFGSVEDPYLPRPARLFPHAFDEQDGEGEDAESDLDEDAQQTHHVAAVAVILLHTR